MCLCFVQFAYAQRTITGVITDESSGETLIGANVVVTGTQIGVTTDINGGFSLKVPDGANSLTVSYVGYADQKISIEGQNQINVILKQGTSLDEVVVTALGLVEKKSRITYAAQKIDAKELNVSRVGDVGQQLSGQVPGLAITTSNGSAVQSSRIILRGESSLNVNRNQPLIVVDGALISNEYIGIGTDAHTGSLPIDYGNSLTDLNPDDFQDITVLKGPKAAALYGSRASNGVLVIRTKSGLAKKGVGVEFSTGAQFDVVNQFWDEQFEYGGGGYNSANGMYNQFRSDWGGNFGPLTDGSLVAQSTPSDPSPEATPFEQRADRKGFFDTGIGTNTNLALSFANDDIWGRLSLGRLSRDGIIPNTAYDKNNVGLRLGTNITDKLRLDFSGNYINSGSDNVPEIGYAFGEGLMFQMLWVMKNFDLDAYEDYWLPGQRYKEQNYFLSWGVNPHLIVNENLNGFTHNRAFGNVKLTYNILDNLSVFARISRDAYDDLRTSQKAPGQPTVANGRYREQDASLSEINADFYMTYVENLSDRVEFKANLGGNLFTQNITNKIAETRDLAIPGIYSLSNAADIPLIDQYDAEKRINSIYGAINLGFDEKIYLDLTARNDWSSTLPSDNNSYFYPSVGVSAILSNMMKMPAAISNARLRASYAETGNDTDPYLTNRVFATGLIPGSISNSDLLVNPELRPERTGAIEVGLDLEFLKNRLGLSLDYYQNTTQDQILRADISHASGATAKLINAGKIESSGIEVLLTAQPVQTKKFGWNTMINWQTNRAQVLELEEGVETFIIAQGPEGATIEARPGGLMGDIYGRGFARSPDGQIIYSTSSGIAIPQTASEKVKVGNYNPDWTMGWINNLNFGKVNLRVHLDYRSGGDFYSLTGSQLYRSGSVTETLEYREQDIVPEGVVENADGTFSPNTVSSPGYDYYRNYWVRSNIEANTYDATFLKLREVALGIDLGNVLQKSVPAFQNAQLSVFARNLFTWTKTDFVRHFDPEVMTFAGGSYIRGFETGQMPGTATFGFNLKIGL